MNKLTGLVDSHFHSASMVAKGMDVRHCLREFFEAGGAGLLDVAVGIEDWEERRALTQEFSSLWLSAGIHPQQAPLISESTWPVLKDQLRQSRVVAVGEIGLDWYRGRDHQEAQKRVFRRQLELAMELDLPVIIHNREADDDLLAVLDEVRWQGRGVFHCFSSDLRMAEQGLQRGFYVSFAGNVTYPSAQNLRDVASVVPTERLLIETDSPYLSPQGQRGRPNAPIYAGLTAQVVADVRGVSLDVLLGQTQSNFEQLMRVSTH